jgi:low affinity Fe/Cu permease
MIQRWLTQVGVATSHPLALAAVAAFVAFWLIFDHSSLDWHAAATVATLLMTVFIQRAERRDTQAIHAKLDELLRAEGKARNELTQLDDQEPEEIIEHRDQERANSERSVKE